MSTLNVDKVDPSTGTALEIGTSGDTITVPSGATFVVAGTTEITGTNNVQRPNVNPLIINGDMAVSQRATSVAGLTNGSDVYVALDRFGFNEYGAPSSIHTMTQEALTADEAYEDGFSTALKMDVTTAQDPLSAADATMIIYKFEGQDLQLIKKGTANAEKLTLAFWVKGTKTGTHICELFDKDNTRTCSQSYTVDSTDTWEQKVVNFPADTTGVLDNDNARSLDISFFLSAGTNYTSGSLQTSWGAYSATESAVGQVNTCDSDSNNFHITGVQLEVGEYTSSTLPPFQHESYGNNLQRCQRYCYNTNQNNTLYAALSVGAATSTTGVYGELYFPVTMRANPTGTVVQSTSYWALNSSGGGTDLFDNILVQNCSTTQGTIYCTGNVSQTAGQASRIRNNNTAARLLVVAEL